jgi:alpha-amylase/alpha-mannosidase (GH57 family)
LADYRKKKVKILSMERNSICVHGHFYQPPREDPLSGLIPDETGAEPFRNWNERILHECYQPNAALGNFEKISFNIGPTLFKWIQAYDPQTYQQIIAQERKNFDTFGVGNAMAQAYNHVILPLANKRDKVTQIKWGIADFKSRFNHDPLGMWLPETAVDLETLAFLSDNQIKFTMLAPWQVDSPVNLSEDQPFFVKLPGNRDPMIVFVYQKDLSTSVSFNAEATRNADYFADHYISPIFQTWRQQGTKMALIASDGELYGHHKNFREKFLSYLLNGVLHQRELDITYPGLWLRNHQPDQYINISEYTSWSCHHGIMRWMGECDCTPGASWKAPLRWGLDKLAEELDHQYQVFMGQYTLRIWQLRNAYIHVLLGEIELKDLLDYFVNQNISENEFRKIGMILAAQYERQRIFTSCAWFFENFHRIEPQNNIAYAAQAVWLTKRVTGKDLKPMALAVLKKVKDQQTGLRGDTVFHERYQRTLDFSEDENAYFNASSSFTT